MRELSFKINDVVCVTGNVTTDYTSLLGMSGVVKHINGKYIGIEFDNPVDGCTDLDGYCRKLSGYYVENIKIKKMEPLTMLLQKQCNQSMFREREKEQIIFIE